MGPDAMIFIFWMLSLKPTFLLSSFAFIKRLFSSSSSAAAAKSLQSCPTLCDPTDGSPLGSAWDSPGKNTGVGCHFSLSAIKVVSSTYLRLLIFLPAILIPDCVSSSPEFLMMYSAYKLNKQGDNIQPWYTPFSIWNQSVVPCPVLTVASWPAYSWVYFNLKFFYICHFLSSL